MAVTYDGSNACFYIDGAQDSCPAYIVLFNSAGGSYSIGSRGASEFYQGLIDEVEFFNRALSATEIDAIFDAGSAGKCRTCTPPPAGLVSWWPGDNNPFDVADNNDGTLQMGAGFAAGLVGPAFSFDGSDDFVKVPDSANLEPPSFTVEAWIKTSGIASDFTNFNRIVVKLNGEGRQAYSLAVGGSTGGGVSGHAELRMQESGGNTDLAVSTTDVNDGIWHHVAGTFDGTNLRIYVDGILENTVAKAFNVPFYSNPGDLFIGSFNGSIQFFHGVIDEVEIFNRALSQAEIQAIVHADTAGKCKGCATPPANMISWWPAQGNANDIKDGNDGTLQGGAGFAAGEVGQAFKFDSADDFVQVANSLNLEPTTITVDLWVKSSAPGANAYLLAKGAQACAFASYSLNIASDTEGDLFIDVLVGAGVFIRSPSAPHASVFDGNWHHVAGTYDGTTVRLYLDGVEQGTGTVTAGNLKYGLSTTNDLFFGRFNSPGFCALTFNGEIDEVEIFSRALTAAEVRDLFEAGSLGKCTACSHGYWKNHTASWTGFTTGDPLSSVFTIPGSLPSCDPSLSSTTLLAALSFKGGPDVCGGARILLRQAVAALLNAAHPGVNYPRSVGQVISDVNAALLTGDRATMLTLAGQLDAENNGVCPLD